MSDPNRWKWIDRVRSWDVWKPPLRPTAEEVNFYEQQIRQVDPALVLLLGVTPEIAKFASREIKIQAVDLSDAMIDKVWPGDHVYRQVFNVDWFELSDRASDFDFVVGDGVMTVVWPPNDRSLLNNVRSVLKHGGKFITRVYNLPATKKTEGEILKGATSNFSQFKLDLLKFEAAEDSRAYLARVYTLFQRLRPKLDIPALGWTKDDLKTIEIYKDSPSSYTFLRKPDLLKLFKDSGFEVTETFIGTDPWSEENPTYVLRRLD